MIEINLEIAGLPDKGSVYKRSAARGIAFRDGKLLVIHTDKGDYKFPGGGVEPGESLEQALGREMLEETGYELTGTSCLWGVAHERRRGRTADILEMDSYYFLCQVGDTQIPLRLDDYEAAEHFAPVWLELDKALHANKNLVDDTQPWLQREIAVMERLREDLASQ